MGCSHADDVQQSKRIILPYEKNEEYFIEELGDVSVPWHYAFIKRLFDIIFSLIAIIILIIPSLIIALIIKLTSEGHVLFKQERLGKDGVKFMILKFRTMYSDAEESVVKWSIGEDDRVTKIGGFLRKTRLDELPQLWNILVNDMSLIGPRPERKVYYDEFELYIHGFKERLKVKPGLTGYAQVYGGYYLKPEEKILYDLEYIKKQSLLMDCKIFFKTVKVLFTGEKKQTDS